MVPEGGDEVIGGVGGPPEGVEFGGGEVVAII